MLTCPGQARLRELALGALSARHTEEMVAHIESCDRCAGVLAELDHCSDDFLHQLRGLSTLDCSCEEPSHKVATDSGVGSDLGQRYARKLARGPCHIGRFELRAELGDGSFGHVFLAHDPVPDRQVAIKVQRAGGFADDEEMRRFLREARSAAQLHHPGIVSLHEVGQTEDGVCFLVTEYIEGETLAEHIDGKPIPPRESARLISELALALHYAHEHGIIHRDVKPSNILLDAEQHPHITDFGLAKRLAEDGELTSDGRILGTPAYLSPEQARGSSQEVDGRSDTYGLGVILYELLTGERPFQGNRRLLLLQVLEDEPRPPRRLCEQIPRDLETICLKAIAKHPSRRYQTARELSEDLNRFLAGEPIKARAMGVPERLWRWSRRYPLATCVMLAMCLGLALGFWYLSYLSTYFVEKTALDSARMETEMLERINAFYSEEVVDRLDPKKVPSSHLYASRKDAIPIPATFTIDSGKYISAGTSGMRVRLYSDYPWRSDGGPKDDFERRALDILTARADRGESDLAFAELSRIEGQRVVRYAKGQIMKTSCLKCHNGEGSPKRWKEGDLVGVLAVTHPLDRDVERARAGLSGAFIVLSGLAAAFVTLSIVLVLIARARSRARPQTS